ncbi:hypothetical protein [Cryptosporangium aurantiacum]|uniref:Uncharacterized protein n=1 Tax=Cryptosporangium aurantiacum TaxID=134849 RepID=A0A1M7RFX7_9ACTN|nr:hypothetical protein [Cryptosporangium aurantiacum]SHN45140.1 hypothetical protein SAMN05443668_111158 [Cryptosporangium aurantiacum]
MRRLRRLLPSLVPILVIAGLLGLFYLFAPHYSTVLWWEFREALFWIVPIAGLLLLWVILAGATAAVSDRRSYGSGFSEVAVGGLSVLVGGAALVAVIWWLVSTHGYEKARAYFTASAKVTTDATPAFGQRAPFPVAEAQARPNLGDVSGDVVDTTYLPQRGSFASLVKRRGWASSGYEVTLDQEVPLAGGRGDGTTCTFDRQNAARRDGGWWHHNLARALHNERRHVRYDSGDLYSYCDGDRPVVVIPLKKQIGWMVVSERPAGIALYDGRTGEIEFRDTADGLPGPAYPLSLAAKQRDALQASGGYWDYRGGRSGWVASEDDTNSGNNTEFVLPTTAAGNRPSYVTMLTGRGDATAISALAVVDGRVRSGELATIVVHRTKPGWVSPDAVSSRIKADYQDLPNWQNQKIMEIAPISSSRWVATIGNGQNVLYRVQGSGDLRGENPTCLVRADGSTIRCGTLADQDGRGVGTEYGSGSPPGTPSDLSKLTDQELADLQRKVADEVAKRLEKGTD